MKKFLFLLVCLAFTLPAQAIPPGFNACDVEPKKYEPIAERYKKGLLFAAVKCGEKPAYIFGTIHSDRADIEEMLEPVYKTISKIDQLNLELKTNPLQALEVMNVMFYPFNSARSLKNTIGEKLYLKLNYLVREHRPELNELTYSRMKPWAVSMLLQVPPPSGDGVAVDLRLEQLALRLGKQVEGLETTQEQLKIFSDLSEADQTEFLRLTIENYDKAEKINDKLFKLYKNKDLKGMEKLSKVSFNLMKDLKFGKELADKLLKNRNETMVESALPAMKQKKTLTAVGALHLPGKDGILKLLEDEGYFIYVVD